MADTVTLMFQSLETGEHLFDAEIEREVYDALRKIAQDTGKTLEEVIMETVRAGAK